MELKNNKSVFLLFQLNYLLYTLIIISINYFYNLDELDHQNIQQDMHNQGEQLSYRNMLNIFLEKHLHM